jgi:hypothetical protein
MAQDSLPKLNVVSKYTYVPPYLSGYHFNLTQLLGAQLEHCGEIVKISSQLIGANQDRSLF